MNKKQKLDIGRWLIENKGNLGKLALVALVVGFSIFTGLRLSDVEGDLEDVYSVTRPYLSGETQARVDSMLAQWDVYSDTVVSLEDWLFANDEIEAQGITNFDQLYLQARSTTPVLQVDQLSTGDVVSFQDNGTEVWSIADGGAVTAAGAQVVDGASDVIQFTVQGWTTQTSSLIVAEQSDGTDKLTLSNEGHAVLIGERDAATGYDYFLTVEGSATGIVNGAKTYAMQIDMDRPAGYESGGGDLDDAGLKIRVETEAVTTTAGTTLRAVDAEAKVDNPSGTVTNLYGGSFTAKSDTSAGSVATMVALSANTQNNAAVTTYLAAGDFRLFRQSATVPTEAYVAEFRNSSTTGAGANAALFINSDYGSSATTDSFDYGIDMASAAINTADIRFENGTTLSENTDTILTFSEFIGGTEQSPVVVTAGSSITATGTFQPISSASGVTTSTSVPVVAGTQDGQILILQNVNASDTITVDGTGGTVECKADVVLGSFDTMTLVWNGSDWYCIAVYDNS